MIDMDRKFRIQFFGEEGDDAGKNPPAEPAGKNDPAEKPKDKSFTQADVDKFVQKRLEQERKKYEGFDELKEKAAKFDEFETQKKKDAGDYESLLNQEREQHQQELAKQKEEIERMKQEAAEEKRNVALDRVLEHFKLPTDHKVRGKLQGDAYEEIMQDAEETFGSFFVPAEGDDKNPPTPGKKPIGAPAAPAAAKPSTGKSDLDRMKEGEKRAMEQAEASRKKNELPQVI